MKRIVTQQYDVSNPIDKDLAIVALAAALSSAIFQELINNEKEKLVVTLTIDLKE